MSSPATRREQRLFTGSTTASRAVTCSRKARPSETRCCRSPVPQVRLIRGRTTAWWDAPSPSREPLPGRELALWEPVRLGPVRLGRRHPVRLVLAGRDRMARTTTAPPVGRQSEAAPPDPKVQTAGSSAEGPERMGRTRIVLREALVKAVPAKEDRDRAAQARRDPDKGVQDKRDPGREVNVALRRDLRPRPSCPTPACSIRCLRVPP